MKSRGVPIPTKDIDGLFATVEALRESVESDAQNLRGRRVQTADPSRALAERDAQSARTTAQREIETQERRLSSMESQMGENTTGIEDHEIRIVALEAAIIDHEARIVALETAP